MPTRTFRCKEYPENAREFRKKDGVEAMRDEAGREPELSPTSSLRGKSEVVYRPGETTDNHLFYSLCVVDCARGPKDQPRAATLQSDSRASAFLSSFC